MYLLNYFTNYFNINILRSLRYYYIAILFPCDIISCNIISCDIISCDIIPCDIIPGDIMLVIFCW